MSWTENKWLKPAWMGENNDFVNKYQDKFAKIGEKFAPEIKSKNKKNTTFRKGGIQIYPENESVVETIFFSIPIECRDYLIIDIIEISDTEKKAHIFNFQKIDEAYRNGVGKTSGNFKKLYDIAKYLNGKREILSVKIGESIATKVVTKWESKKEKEEEVIIHKTGPYEDPLDPSIKGIVLGMTQPSEVVKVSVGDRKEEDEADELNVKYIREKVTTSYFSDDGKHQVLVSGEYNHNVVRVQAQTFAHEAFGHFWSLITNKTWEHAIEGKPINTALENLIEEVMREAEVNAFSN